MRSSDSAAYRDLVVERLRSVLEAHGTSVAAVEKRLDHGRGYVSDALRGHKKLSIETILEVLEVIGIGPQEFFEGRLPGPRASSRERRPAPPPALARRPLREASPIVQAVLLVLAKKGVLTA